jgi:flagellar biosynthesis chaperone FliJ
MFKRLMILGIIGITFVLGANYLLVYALNQQAKRERDRQNPNYWNAYAAIVRFGQHPDSASEQRAKAALDEASQKGLSKTRAKILQNYLEDLERCYQGQRDSCKQATSDMNEAMRVPTERQ